MDVFINTLSCISHYNTVDENFFFEDTSSIPSSNFLFVTPPVYKDHIPANIIRRSSHVLKMGVSTGLICAGKSNSKIDAIITGTAIGCFEDTDKFLRSMDENNERTLTPTSFIQSTHNSVGGQLALLLNCHGYNFTYVQQNLSFEYALLDAMLLLKEKEAETILLGGLDELNPSLCELFERAGHIKNKENCNEKIWQSSSKGYLAGEGAAFFNLTSIKSDANIAKIKGVKILPKLSGTNMLLTQYNDFINELNSENKTVDLILSGASGDSEKDKDILKFTKELNLPTAYFKHLCGEYFTASSFALWLAASILKKQLVPNCVMDEKKPGELNTILIVNHFNNEHYSLIYISKC